MKRLFEDVRNAVMMHSATPEGDSTPIEMTVIRVKKGYSLNMAGKPSKTLEVMSTPDRLAVIPERMPFIKPRPMVQEGDFVKIGTPLFSDKHDSRMRFLSPGCGTVSKIRFGPRRVIQEIVVRIADTEDYEPFEVLSESTLPSMDREVVVEMMVQGGLWPLLRELPFRNIAPMSKVPPAIIVHLGMTGGSEPQPGIYLKGRIPHFQFGLRVLKRLSKTVYVVVTGSGGSEMDALKQIGTHFVSGDYPAADPGVFLYHIKRSADENRAWYIDGQDVLMLANLLSTGQYPTERIVALSGDAANKPRHVKTRIGAPLSYLAALNGSGEGIRFLLGSVFSGYAGAHSTYLGFYDKSLTLVKEGRGRELLAFVRPGLNKPTYSKTFLSRFNRDPLTLDCDLHGEIRACIACGYCVEVCPVDILPQLMFKSIESEEVAESLAHGLLDCVECGLCAFVCPSKIELLHCFTAARAAYYKEQN